MSAHNAALNPTSIDATQRPATARVSPSAFPGATQRRDSIPARSLEALFVTTLTVSDDELHQVSFAHPYIQDAPIRRRRPVRRKSRFDITLIPEEGELHPVVLTRGQLAWTEASLGFAIPIPSVAPESGSPLGQIIADKYRVLDSLGRGGMGVVYKVEDIRTGALFAMKLLSGRLSAREELVARLRQEAIATSRLSHANTVRMVDFGESAQQVYLVMEFLQGCDLASVIRRDGPLPAARVVNLALQICGSMAEAHEHGIVHRDIKPENIFLLESSSAADTVKVLDFGIAQVREKEPSPSSRNVAIIGTPNYMAPEQIRGEHVDGRADVYALGALIYKSLTGLAPFCADTPAEVLGKHLHEQPQPMGERVQGLQIAAGLEAAVARALSKDPAQRQSSVRELEKELVACLATHTKQAPVAPSSTASTTARPGKRKSRKKSKKR